MRRAVMLATLLALGSGVALAQNLDLIKQRKELFKAMGGAAGPMGKMLQGEVEFDLAKVKAGIATIRENSARLPAMFPADTAQGGDTAALPAIWQDKARFEGMFAKLGQDAEAAANGVKDQASFRALVPKMLGNCSACHKEFVKPQ